MSNVQGGQGLQLVLAYCSFAVAAMGIIVAVVSMNIASDSRNIAVEAKEFATRPAHIIAEVESEKNFLTDFDEYYIGGPPDVRRDNIVVNIWNVGAKVGENITVSVFFDPPSRADLYDVHSTVRCRELVCIQSGSPSHIRAIEPNGFYSTKTDIEVKVANLQKSKEPLYLKIKIVNPDPFSRQELNYAYKVII